MENREDTIKECYKLFKLDERASKTEVELAFEVLTSSKNLPTEEYKHYRLAFEYLMHEVYTETEDCETEEVEEQKFDSTIRYIPEKVKTSIDSWEKFNEEELSSKVKTLFATQTVNLPMFFNSIISNSKNIFGKFHFYTSYICCLSRSTFFICSFCKKTVSNFGKNLCLKSAILVYLMQNLSDLG